MTFTGHGLISFLRATCLLGLIVLGANDSDESLLTYSLELPSKLSEFWAIARSKSARLSSLELDSLEMTIGFCLVPSLYSFSVNDGCVVSWGSMTTFGDLKDGVVA